MNKLWLLPLFLFLTAGCAAKQTSGIPHPQALGYRIAVIPFESANPYLSGVTFSDCFTAQILRLQPGLQIVERKDLMKVFQEQKLGLTGVVRNDNISNLGSIFGADAILIGSVQTLKILDSVGGAISVTVKIMDVRTAKVVWADRQKISHATWYAQEVPEVADALIEKTASRMVKNMVRALDPNALAAAKIEDDASTSKTIVSLSR